MFLGRTDSSRYLWTLEMSCVVLHHNIASVWLTVVFTPRAITIESVT